MTTRSTRQPKSPVGRRTAYLATGMAIFGFGVAHTLAEPANDNERNDRVVTSRTAGSVAGGAGQPVTADSRAARVVTRIQDRRGDALTRLVQLREDRTASVVVREPLDLTGGGLKPIAGGTHRMLVDGQISGGGSGGSGSGGSGGGGSGGSSGGGGSGGGDPGSGGGDTGGGDPGSGGSGGEPGSGGSGSGGTSDPGSGGETFVRLVPGNGFDKFMPNSNPVGHPEVPGYDAKAIARWDVVPYQVIDGEFHIGVVAFHMNDIDHVLFSAEGGPWKRVDEMQLNPRTNVWEYTAVLDAADFQDGPIEIRAVVYPKVGAPRVLAGPIHRNGEESGYTRNGEHSMFLVANNGGTVPAAERWVCWQTGDDENSGSEFSPFQTIHAAAMAIQSELGGDAGGGTIYLMEGEHPWTGWSASGRDRNPRVIQSNRSWLTITRDPNADRDKVVIGSLSGEGDASISDSAGLRAHLVRLRDVTISTSVNSASMRSHDSNPTLWFDGVHITFPREFNEIVKHQSSVGTTIAGSTSWVGGVYATDTEITKVRNAAMGWHFCRNVSVTDVIADAFREQVFNVNGRVARIGMHPAPEHADVIQWYITNDEWDNIIVYGLKAVESVHSQAFFGRQYNNHMPFSNAAFVNCLLAPSSNFGQWQLGGRHQLFWNFKYVGRNGADTRFLFRDDTSGTAARWENLVVRNSVFEGVQWWASQDITQNNIKFQNNHFITGSPIGEYATTGNPMFRDPVSGDFAPGVGSPLLYRSEQKLAPADIMNRKLVLPAAIGAVQPD